MEKKKSIFNIDVIREKFEKIDDSLGASVICLILFASLILEVAPAFALAFSDFPLWLDGLMKAYPSATVILGVGTIGTIFVLGYLCYGLYVCLGNIYRITYNREQKRKEERETQQKEEPEE